MQQRNPDIYICAVYLVLITCAEILTAYEPKAGVALHVFVMFALLLHSTLEAETNKKLSQLLMALVLAPLIRILSLSMPFPQFGLYFWLLIVSIPVFVAIATCMWLQGLRPKDVGFRTPQLRDLPIEGGVILLAVPFGIAEYLILKPAPSPVAAGSGFMIFFAAILIFIVCTGFLEEIAFRGLLQHSAIRLMSKWWGIFFVSAVFGVLHAGNCAILDCLLAFTIGFIFSIVRERTGSIYGISISHGVTNYVLFFVAPTIAQIFA